MAPTCSIYIIPIYQSCSVSFIKQAIILEKCKASNSSSDQIHDQFLNLFAKYTHILGRALRPPKKQRRSPLTDNASTAAPPLFAATPAHHYECQSLDRQWLWAQLELHLVVYQNVPPSKWDHMSVLHGIQKWFQEHFRVGVFDWKRCLKKLPWTNIDLASVEFIIGFTKNWPY